MPGRGVSRLSSPVSKGHSLSAYASGPSPTVFSVSKFKAGFHGNFFWFQHTVTEQQVCALTHTWERGNGWLSHDQIVNQSYEVVPGVCRLWINVHICALHSQKKKTKA